MNNKFFSKIYWFCMLIQAFAMALALVKLLNGHAFLIKVCIWNLITFHALILISLFVLKIPLVANEPTELKETLAQPKFMILRMGLQLYYGITLMAACFMTLMTTLVVVERLFIKIEHIETAYQIFFPFGL